MTTLTDFIFESRPETMLEVRSIGPIDMVEVTQEPGSFPDPAHNSYVLQLCISAPTGAVEIGYGGYRYQRTTVGAHELCLAPAGTDCTYDLSGSTSLMCCTLPKALVHEVGLALDPQFGSDLGALHTGFFRRVELVQGMQRLWRAASAQTAQALEAETLAAALVERLVGASRSPIGIKPPRSHLSWHVRCQVLAFIQEHLADNISLGQLARLARLSDYHFLRAFKAELGTTPHQYVMDQRIHRAKILLKRPHSGLADVALACGFNTHQHFSTVFKRAEGRTPSEFRTQSRYFGTTRNPLAPAVYR
jgi:AraC family transcriptional regulator